MILFEDPQFFQRGTMHITQPDGKMPMKGDIEDVVGKEIPASLTTDEDNNGFTLIELVIAVVILGIIAALIIFFAGGQTEEARETAVQESADRGYSAAEAQYRSQGADGGDAGIVSTVEGLSTDKIRLSVVDPEDGTLLTRATESEEIMSASDLCVVAEWSGEEDVSATAGACAPSVGGSIGGGSEDEEEESTTFEVTYSLDSGKNISLPIFGTDGSLDVDCGNGYSGMGENNLNCNYESAGEYTITVDGDFTGFGTQTTGPTASNEGDAASIMPNVIDITSVSKWPSSLESLNFAFVLNNKLQSVVAPPSGVTSMSGTFYGSSFNGDISNWDTSNVTNMSRMFFESQYNGDIGKWDISRVNNTSHMFYNADFFNQDISAWNTSNISNMIRMFNDADVFNQDIGDWDTSNVIEMGSMFNEASSFNQDLTEWDVDNVDYYSKFNELSALEDSNVPNFN